MLHFISNVLQHNINYVNQAHFCHNFPLISAASSPIADRYDMGLNAQRGFFGRRRGGIPSRQKRLGFASLRLRNALG